MIEEKSIRKVIEDGGKVTTTRIEEKNKDTTIVKIEPVNGKATSSKTIQNKDEIIISYD